MLLVNAQLLLFVDSSLFAVYHDWFPTAKGRADIAENSLNELFPGIVFEDRRKSPGWGDGIPPAANAAAAANSLALASKSLSSPPKTDDDWFGKNLPVPCPSILSLPNMFTKISFIWPDWRHSWLVFESEEDTLFVVAAFNVADWCSA